MAYSSLPSPGLVNGLVTFSVPGSAAGTLQVRLKAAGSNPAGAAASAAVPAAGGGTLPVPGAPSWSFNTQTRILSLTPPSGYSASLLEYKQGSGAYQPYTAGLSIDAAAHNAGEWTGRVKATASNQVGPAAGSPSIAATGGGSTSEVAGMLLYGQSNNLGTGHVDRMDFPPLNTITPDPRTTNARARIWYPPANGLQALQLGVNNLAASDATQVIGQPHPPSYGPEAGLAARWLQKNASGQLVIVKHSRDGASIEQLSKGGQYYGELVSYFNATKSALQVEGKTLRLDAFVLTQGEGNVGSYQGYRDKLAQLVADLRADGVIQPTTKIIINGILANGDYANITTEQQAYVATEPLATYVSTQGLTTLDGTHYDAVGQMYLGADRDYNAIFGTTGSIFPTLATPLAPDNTNINESDTNYVSFPSGNWQTASGTNYFGGAGKFIAIGENGEATLQFTSARLSIKTPRFGSFPIKFDVIVTKDGEDTTYTIDLPAGGPNEDSKERLLISDLGSGIKTLRVVARAQYNAFAIFDCVTVISAAIIVPDGRTVVAAGTTVQENDPAWSLDSQFGIGSDAKYYGGAAAAARGIVTSSDIYINGTQFFLGGPGIGIQQKFEVWIDDQYSSTVTLPAQDTAKSEYYTSPLLPAGNHRVQIKTRDAGEWGDFFVIIDQLRVA